MNLEYFPSRKESVTLGGPSNLISLISFNMCSLTVETGLTQTYWKTNNEFLIL